MKQRGRTGTVVEGIEHGKHGADAEDVVILMKIHHFGRRLSEKLPDGRKVAGIYACRLVSQPKVSCPFAYLRSRGESRTRPRYNLSITVIELQNSISILKPTCSILTLWQVDLIFCPFLDTTLSQLSDNTADAQAPGLATPTKARCATMQSTHGGPAKGRWAHSGRTNIPFSANGHYRNGQSRAQGVQSFCKLKSPMGGHRGDGSGWMGRFDFETKAGGGTWWSSV
jgi:hypothetical protein